VVVEVCFYDWKPVSSGVPQGSVLGSFLLVKRINELDVNVGGMISKFTDDRKHGDVVNSKEEKP